MKVSEFRECGICGEKAIQRGVEWPWWKDGRPICFGCQLNLIRLPKGDSSNE